MTRLDYTSAVLADLPSHLLNRLQSVLNAAARLVCHARKYDHVTHLLLDLHWLRIPETIQFQLAMFLSAFVTTRRLRISLIISIGLMKRNHCIDYHPVPAHAWSFLELGSAPLAIDHFMWLSHVHGAVFLPTSLHQLFCRLSRDNLKYYLTLLY